MATISTGSISVTEALDFITPSWTGTTSGLADCIDSSVDGLYDPLYWDLEPPTDRLTGFRGYGNDTEAPTVPTNLAHSLITDVTFTLSWTASTDNVGIAGYKLYRAGTLKYTTTGTGTSKAITGQTPASTFTWTVKAYDDAGNLSAASSGLSVTMHYAYERVTTASDNLSHAEACSDQSFAQRYSNGTKNDVSVGDTIYTDTAGTTVFVGSGEYYQFPDSGKTATISSGGVVGFPAGCTPA